MNTSYYAKSGNLFYGVSIARRSPFWYNNKEYKKLAPSAEILFKYKKDGDEKAFTEAFKKELEKLDPKEVFKDLGENAVLLCWEKSGKFCHRHIVGKWLKDNLGVEITELE